MPYVIVVAPAEIEMVRDGVDESAIEPEAPDAASPAKAR